jgi:Phage terminase, small subunit
MRGRPPKPTRMKVLTGNPGKRPLNKDEPRPDPVIPDCPPELSPAAQREWTRLVKELSSLNMVTRLDRAALATYCGAYALWAEIDPGHSKIWRHGEIAHRLSDAVALHIDRESSGRDHDAHSVRVWIYTRKPEQDLCSHRARPAAVRLVWFGRFLVPTGLGISPSYQRGLMKAALVFCVPNARHPGHLALSAS